MQLGLTDTIDIRWCNLLGMYCVIYACEDTKLKSSNEVLTTPGYSKLWYIETCVLAYSSECGYTYMINSFEVIVII